MRSFFNPRLILMRINKIEGFDVVKNSIFSNPKLDFIDLFNGSLEQLEDDYSDWPEGQGFGSSDFTYALQSFIDYMIDESGLGGVWKTDFKPYLQIVKI